MHALRSHRPILTPKTVLPLFFVLGVIFAPLGGLLLYASFQVCPGAQVYRRSKFLTRTLQVQEISIDYSTCIADAPNTTDPASTIGLAYVPSNKFTIAFREETGNGAYPQWRRYQKNTTYSRGIPNNDSTVRGGFTVPSDVCQIQFRIPNDIGQPVFLFYRLSNFFQNHRRYVKSLDTNQLLGQSIPNTTIADGSCDPLKLNADKKPYYPCGLIANSLFNDTIGTPRGIQTGNYSMTNVGIAWSSDKNLYGPTTYKPQDVAVPPNWQSRWGPDGYTEENPPPDLSTYEAFQVWMRTAGLPTFSKLALRNDNDVMPKGDYRIDIISSKCAHVTVRYGC